MGRREAGFDCPDIQHSPIPLWQLPESLLAYNLLQRDLLTQGSKHCLNISFTSVDFAPGCLASTDSCSGVTLTAAPCEMAALWSE
jgi:hypothetical protein